MKKTNAFALVLLLVSSAPCLAAEVPLPPFEVQDSSGTPVSSDALKQTQPWCMLIIAAERKDARETIARFHRDAGWDGRLVVVVVGDEAGFASLAEDKEKMAGVQWYRDGTGGIIKRLNLSGLPVLLGVIPGDAIAWRSSGIPGNAVEAQSLVSTWLNTNL